MADDHWGILNAIFSRLGSSEFEKLASRISVINSSNVQIKNNKFNTNIYINGFLNNPTSNTGKIYIPFDEKISDDKLERAITNNDYLDKFIFSCNQKGVCPVFRYYGLFSHISTLRRKSDYSEYNQLILEEKRLFDKMVGLDYKIKLIISLDIPIIITKWGYSIDETKARIANLCDNIDATVNDHNIEVVIDEKNSMDSLYICDHCLLIKAVNIDPVKKYSMTRYITNQFEIDNWIREFDQKFEYCKLLNQGMQKMMNLHTLSSMIRAIIDNRIEEYYGLLNKGEFRP